MLVNLGRSRKEERERLKYRGWDRTKQMKQNKRMIKVRKKGAHGTSTRQIQTKRVPVQQTRTREPPVSVLFTQATGLF